MISKLEKLLAEATDPTVWKGTRLDAEERLKDALRNCTGEFIALYRAAAVVHGSMFRTDGGIDFDCGEDDAIEFGKAFTSLNTKLKETLGE